MKTKTFKSAAAIAIQTLPPRSAEDSPDPTHQTQSDSLPLKTMDIRKPLDTKWQQTVLRMERTSDEVQLMATESQAWAARFQKWEKEGRHLLLIGGTGKGKTLCAKRLFAWAESVKIDVCMRHKMPTVPVVEWVEFGEICKLEGPEFREWLIGREETKLMFLEDIGAETDPFKSGEPVERLREILNLFAHRWMVITTNIFPIDWEARWDDRVSDRLMRNSKSVKLKQTPRFSAVKGKL